MVTYTDARPICLAGDWYAVRAGFTWERSGASLSFECDDEQDARAWVALALAKDGVTEGRPPGAPGGGADALVGFPFGRRGDSSYTQREARRDARDQNHRTHVLAADLGLGRGASCLS